MAKPWTNSGKVILSSGKVVLCNECPCGTGSSSPCTACPTEGLPTRMVGTFVAPGNSMWDGVAIEFNYNPTAVNPGSGLATGAWVGTDPNDASDHNTVLNRAQQCVSVDGFTWWHFLNPPFPAGPFQGSPEVRFGCLGATIVFFGNFLRNANNCAPFGFPGNYTSLAVGTLTVTVTIDCVNGTVEFSWPNNGSVECSLQFPSGATLTLVPG